jgi:hypothetical protein
MKLLNNPIVVGALAVVAVGYTVWTITGSGRPRHTPRTPPPAAMNPAPTPTPTPSPATTTPPPTPSTPTTTTTTTASHRLQNPIKLAVIQTEARRWLESPRRDPFQILASRTDAPQGPSAAQLLSLRAIWRQTGSQLAILNEKILREGDQVLGFAVETIEADGVWVRSTNGRERVSFRTPTLPQPPTPNPTDDANARGLLDPPASQSTITATLPVAPPQ